MNIEQMAREVGYHVESDGITIPYMHFGDLERFAALVRDQALEEAAIIGEDAADFSHSGHYVAAAIRALKASPDAEVK